MGIICSLLTLYLIVLFARVIFSYFPITPDSPLESVNVVLRMLTEPVLAPLRRAIPPVRMGAMGMDLSPLIVFFVIVLVLQPLLCR